MDHRVHAFQYALQSDRILQTNGSKNVGWNIVRVSSRQIVNHSNLVAARQKMARCSGSYIARPAGD
jgi:hypothetical protein